MREGAEEFEFGNRKSECGRGVRGQRGAYRGQGTDDRRNMREDGWRNRRPSIFDSAWSLNPDPSGRGLKVDGIRIERLTAGCDWKISCSAVCH
jgi:hypothetical protein